LYAVAVATIVLLLALRLLSLLRGVVCDFCGTSTLEHADVALQRGETCLTLRTPYFRTPDCMHLAGNTVLELSLTSDTISLRCRHAGWSERDAVNPHGGSIASNNKVFTSARFDLLNGRDTTLRESHVTRKRSFYSETVVHESEGTRSHTRK